MTVRVGDRIPSWSMEDVDAGRMRTMAPILRDPYPVHWDRAANAAMGLGGRLINQGPTNLGYVVNMLMVWAGPTSVKRLTVSFARPVLDGDRVVAEGQIVELEAKADESLAVCDVWLDRDGERVVEGRAVVSLPDHLEQSLGERGASGRQATAPRHRA